MTLYVGMKINKLTNLTVSEARSYFWLSSTKALPHFKGGGGGGGAGLQNSLKLHLNSIFTLFARPSLPLAKQEERKSVV